MDENEMREQWEALEDERDRLLGEILRTPRTDVGYTEALKAACALLSHMNDADTDTEGVTFSADVPLWLSLIAALAAAVPEGGGGGFEGDSTPVNIPPDHLRIEILNDPDPDGCPDNDHFGPPFVFVLAEESDKHPGSGMAGGCLTCLVRQHNIKVVPV
jgi:hypothetical protein